MDLERVIDYVRKSEELATELAQRLRNVFSDNENVFILYCGYVEGLSTHLNTILRIVKPQLNVAVFEGDYCSTMMLPYVADALSTVLLLSDTKGVRCAYRAMQTVSALGIKALFILPVPVVSGLRSYLSALNRMVEVLELESELYRLAMLQAFLRLALELGGREVPRIKRIEKELNFKDVVKDLVEAYSNELTSISTIRSAIVTRSLLAAGEELVEKGVFVRVLSKDVVDLEPTILVYTTVEEHVVNEYLVELSRKGLKLGKTLRLRLNMDPLTAPIYALTLLYTKLS